MKVSLHVVRQYLDFDLPPIDELVAAIGAQLGEIEEVIDNKPKYEKVRIAKIVSCQPLQDSDHLNLCMIDDGQAEQGVERNSEGYVQVVCGAPNVRNGMMVAWLPPGSTVPSTYGSSEAFVLSVRPLRGVNSNGMLASAKELALGDDHDGILELDDSPIAGDNFAERYGLNDVIIDIENKMFTHRPDCFGQLGIAREISGIFGHKFDESKGYHKFTELPAKLSSEQHGGGLQVRVINEIPELVPRFTVQSFDGITVTSSPVIIQAALITMGIRPINNIVDITNYIMALTGQPTHAYDYDKVLALCNGDTEPTIVIRQPHSQEEIVLLNGKTITPRSEAILIATPNVAIGVAGVMGGLSTEVSESTTRIIFEVANFDMYSVRKTSMAHGLFSEAVTRFSKGQSPLQTIAVMYLAADIFSNSGIKPVGSTIDDNHIPEHTLQRNSIAPHIAITSEFINQRLGSDLDTEACATMLRNVGFIIELTDDSLHVLAPFWRTDIELREDVVEEVGRLYGYDRLPTPLPQRSLVPSAASGLLPLKQKIRTALAAAGANELLTYSFVHGNLLKKVGQDVNNAYKLSNALSPDLQYLRLSLTPSLLDKVHPNIKAGFDAFALFEIGRSHGFVAANAGLPEANDVLALVYSALPKSGFTNSGAAYYQAKTYVEFTLRTAGVGISVNFEQVSRVPAAGGDDDHNAHNSAISAPFDPQRSAWIIVKGITVGIVGEYRPEVLKQLKLPSFCAGFEIDLGRLQTLPTNHSHYSQLSKYPKTSQDITLKVSVDQPYSAIHAAVIAGLAQGSDENLKFELEPLAIFVPEISATVRSITFRVAVTSSQQTLTEQQVTTLLDTVNKVAAQQVGAERA